MLTVNYPDSVPAYDTYCLIPQLPLELIQYEDSYRPIYTVCTDLSDILSSIFKFSLNSIIGDRAFNRLQELQKIKAGWNFGSGKPLDARSIETSKNLFARLRQFPNKESLRIYLTEEGGLRFTWENLEGNTVMISCNPNNYSVFNETSDLDQDFSLDEIDGVLNASGLNSIVT